MSLFGIENCCNLFPGSIHRQQLLMMPFTLHNPMPLLIDSDTFGTEKTYKGVIVIFVVYFTYPTGLLYFFARIHMYA